MKTATDLLGQTISVGDIICYGTTAGRSAQIGFYEVLEVLDEGPRYSWSTETTFAVKAAPIGNRSYTTNHKKQVKLSMLERALVLPSSYRELIEKDNNENPN